MLLIYQQQLCSFSKMFCMYLFYFLFYQQQMCTLSNNIYLFTYLFYQQQLCNLDNLNVFIINKLFIYSLQQLCMLSTQFILQTIVQLRGFKVKKAFYLLFIYFLIAFVRLIIHFIYVFFQQQLCILSRQFYVCIF